MFHPSIQGQYQGCRNLEWKRITNYQIAIRGWRALISKLHYKWSNIHDKKLCMQLETLHWPHNTYDDNTTRGRKRAKLCGRSILFGRAVNGPCLCCGVIFDARRHVCHRPELRVLLPKHNQELSLISTLQFPSTVFSMYMIYLCMLAWLQITS